MRAWPAPLLLLAPLLLASLSAGATDLVLFNGMLWTGDPARPAATAIAIEDGRIRAVGDDAAMLALADATTTRIDLKGRRAVPGINDAHVHLDVGLHSIDLPLRDADLASVGQAVAEQPQDHDRWITADIAPALLDEPGLHIAALDALQPRRPVFLTGWTGHGTLMNSAAARALGLDAGQAPPGGWLGRDALGRFDGRAYEYAQWQPVRRLPPRPERLREVLRRDSGELLKLGITSIQNLPMRTALPDYLAAWKDAGSPLRMRVVRVPMPASLDEPVAYADLPREVPGQPRVTVSGTKWIIDGTPMERGAAMRQPYPGSTAAGRLNFSPAELQAILREIQGRGDQAWLHISGDTALAAVLDAKAAVAPAAAWRPLRPRIEHGEGLAPDLMARAAEFGLLLVQNPSHFMLPEAESELMRKRQLQPLASAARGGVPLALGSDGPPSPWLNMMFAVAPASRPDEALTRAQVLQAYTAGSAYAEFAEGEKGRLAPGYLADLAVLSQDVLDEAAVPLRALPGTSSMLTVIGGEVAWRDPAM